MGGEPDYAATVQRILDILQADDQFSSKISEFRFGELPEEHNANGYPACYVTTSTNPEISREALTSTTPGKMPGQKIVTEYWIVCVASRPTSAETQKQLYELKDDIYRILEGNTQLRKKEVTDEEEEEEEEEEQQIGQDPLCAFLVLYTQGRLTKQRGSVVDGLTVRVRCTTARNPVT